ncbi:hypothetical protein [Actinoplanes palleronii]|nr:hypothetical protein [Actinoplanes palleronii]
MKKILRQSGAVAVLALALGAAPAAPALAADAAVVGVCGATNFAFVVSFPARGGYESTIISPRGNLTCWVHQMSSINKTEAINVWAYPIPGNSSRVLICSVNKNLSTVATFSISVRGKETTNTGCNIT